MQMLSVQKPLAFVITLLLLTVICPLTSIADTDYTAFQNCVRKQGTGILCSDKLPKDDKHRSVFEKWTKAGVVDQPPAPSLQLRDQWLPGGLNTPSAASILLDQQLSSF